MVKRIFFLAFTIMILQISVCSAKLIYDNTGKITFETSNEWYYTSFGEDIATYELHSIALNPYTCVIFKQSKYAVKYNSMAQMSISEKSVLRDQLLQFHIDLFKNKGYSVRVNKTEIFDDSIVISLFMKRRFSEYRALLMYCIKGNAVYSICCMGDTNSIFEATKVVKTLKIDGIPFDDWEPT